MNNLNQLTQTPLIQPGTSDKINWPWIQFLNGLGQSEGSAGVSSLNALIGALVITGVGGITVTAAGSTIQISGAALVIPNFADDETPTDSGDHQTFTLAQTPNPGASLILALNGVVQQQGGGNDYTLSGSTITMSAPLSGTFTMLAWYRY